jgi:hypothetical protein
MRLYEHLAKASRSTMLVLPLGTSGMISGGESCVEIVLALPDGLWPLRSPGFLIGPSEMFEEWLGDTLEEFHFSCRL